MSRQSVLFLNNKVLTDLMNLVKRKHTFVDSDPEYSNQPAQPQDSAKVLKLRIFNRILNAANIKWCAGWSVCAVVNCICL